MLRPALLEAVAQELRELERESASAGVPGIVVTLPWKERGRLHNAVALVADGRSELRFKHELPNYGVFDEKRIFEAGPLPEPVKFRNTRLGLPICEDIWFDAVTTHLAQRGAQLLLRPQRLALRSRQVRASSSSSHACARPKPACRSRT